MIRKVGWKFGGMRMVNYGVKGIGRTVRSMVNGLVGMRTVRCLLNQII